MRTIALSSVFPFGNFQYLVVNLQQSLIFFLLLPRFLCPMLNSIQDSLKCILSMYFNVFSKFLTEFCVFSVAVSLRTSGGKDPKLRAERGLKAELRWVGLRHPEPQGRRLLRRVCVLCLLPSSLHSTRPGPLLPQSCPGGGMWGCFPRMPWRPPTGILAAPVGGVQSGFFCPNCQIQCDL